AKAGGNGKQAQELLTRALGSDEIGAARDLGEVLLQNGDAQAAVTQLGKAVLAMPDDGEGHAPLGRALAAIGNTRAAANENKLALAIDPELPLSVPGPSGATPTATKPSARPTESKPAPGAGQPGGGLSPKLLGIVVAAIALGAIFLFIVRRSRAPRRE